jgi:pimeloyl-ACP methyl ester carboxylesterase
MRKYMLTTYGLRLLTCSTFLLAAGVAVVGQTAWVDPSPHQQRLVDVGPNARIEVLDWGGSGRTLVLLAQLGQTAHVYDEWAPTLASRYHVIGITRRGYGGSSAAGGYSAEELATDILRVLDAADVRDAILLGNGFAGEEMSWIAERFPNRIGGLVYLNAAYDRTNIAAEGAIAQRIPRRGPGPEDMASIHALRRWASNGSGVQIPESEYRQLAQLTPDGRVSGQRTSPDVQQKILAGMVKHDYSAIRVSVLAIYAKPTSPDSFPGCRATADAAVRQACEELHAWTLQQLEDSRTLVSRIPSNARVVEIPGAHAFVFLSNPTEVMRAIESFVTGVTQ